MTNKRDFYYFRNNGCLQNWLTDFGCCAFCFLWRFVDGPAISAQSCGKLVISGLMLSGLLTIVSFFANGRIPASRLWTYAVTGNWVRCALIFTIYSVAGILFLR